MANCNRSRKSSTNDTRNPAQEALKAKMSGTEKVASSFPYNAAKPSEFGRKAAQPAIGQSVKAPLPVSSSTLSETNASLKVGSGKPQLGSNSSLKFAYLLRA